MKIAVCVCFVPDTSSVVDVVDGSVDLSGINLVMNPYDEYALEAAIQIREQVGTAEVTVFSLLAPTDRELLRKTLAIGADEALQLGESDQYDSMQTASMLSQAMLERYSNTLPDLVICGKQSVDFQNGQVPSMLAELLDLPSVSGVVAMKMQEGGMEVEREIEGGRETIALRFPALISAEKGLNTPRKTTIKSVIAARKTTIEEFRCLPQEPAYVKTGACSLVQRRQQCQIVADVGVLATLLVAGNFI